MVAIVGILGLWSMRRPVPPPATDITYDTSTTTAGALQSPNAPTVAVPLLPPPAPVKKSARAAKVDDSVLGVISRLTSESRFAGLLISTGVASQLSGKGPYTVFLPTNASFELLPPGTLNLSSLQLRRLVQYHIVSGRSIDVNAQLSGDVQALSKDALNFSIFPSDQSARINSSIALKAYKASNGIVYVISEVLQPPLNTRGY